MGDDCELLFFDTFSHDTCEELNLDLVQFPRPVYIFEIRIVPLGARVQADFPGGHRLGATNPSSFQLEFFVNDLSKRSACTFEKLGSLEYKQNVDIQFPVPNKIPTDGLVLRGWYSAVTLAVYGVLTKITKERTSPPPPPPPHSNSRAQDHCHQKEFDPSGPDPASVEWECQPRIESASQEPPPPPVRSHPPVVEGQRFVDVQPHIHPPPDQHVVYSSEIPPSVFTEPPPPLVYQDCVQIPQVSAPPPAAYPQYDAHYAKPWPEEQYQPQGETYDHQLYNRPPDNTLYQPPPEPPHPIWETKDHRGMSDSSLAHDRDNYTRPTLLDLPSLHRDKGSDRDRDRDRNRDRPWDRDLHHSEDSSGRNRDHDLKRKDRGRRSRETSWERNVESDRYRDRIRDSTSRDRERERDRGRDKSRMHDIFMDRRKDNRELITPKRPATPPSPRKGMRPHTPQTPPDYDKVGSGPRTPKEEEPMEVYDERTETDTAHSENFYENMPSEHVPGDPLYHLSEGEIQDGDNTEDDGYEEIVSEEEDMSDVEDRVIDMNEIEFDMGDETWNYMSSFMPYNCELTTFQYFSDPTLFAFEISEKKEAMDNITAENSTESTKIAEFWIVSKEEQRTERWIETIEGINENFLCELFSGNPIEKSKAEISDILVQWIKDGLNFDLALDQPQTAFKVRHLKAGIRLATVVFQTNATIIDKLLEHDVPKLLLELFTQPHMALPLKLFIIRALDAVSTTQAGLEFLVNKTVVFCQPKDFAFYKTEDVKNEEKMLNCTSNTCYQRLLEITMSKQLTRVSVAISALLCKIHTYEILLELSDSVEKVVQNSQITELKPSVVDSPDLLEQRAISVDSEIEVGEAAISNAGESFALNIISCLQEILSIYCNAWKRVAQTKRHLPARNQFENTVSPYDPYPALFRIFKENNLLQNIFVLTSSPALGGHPIVLSAIRDLLVELLTSQEGMLFLLSEPDVINGILRTLLQTVDETREEANDENIAQNLGMQIAYNLQALLYVDSLMAFHAKDSKKAEMDNPEAVSALHHMCTMIFSPFGRQAVVSVLSTAENLKALLPFVEMSGDPALDTKQSKSVCTGYATELIMLVVHYSESVPMLEKFSDALYNLSQQESTPKLHDLAAWMAPTRGLPNFKHEAVTSLMTSLKSHVESAASLPAELVTAIRILQYITLSPDTFGSENAELKYVYAIIQVFAADGTASFLAILQNICDTFLKPSHQSPALTGIQGVMVVAIIKPTISMLKCMLSYLISSRETEFRDLTAVPVLLKVFSLMLLLPPTTASFQQSQAVQSEIIEALLTYTQPILGAAESEEALSKSLWTKMVEEVLKYVNLSPSTFITGLTVLSELLPLPFPLQTREPLLEEEVFKAVNYRKLWSAHLHSLSTTIQDVILSLAATSCHQLQQLLRRVCVQLSDLAAPTALVIVRAVLDALLDALVLPGTLDQKENFDPGIPTTETTPTLKPPTSSTARILTLVSYLVSHASFKIPMMHVLKGSVKADEKYTDVLPLLLELLNGPSDKPFIIQSQECIVSIFQSFCDPDIGFITFDGGAPVNEVLSCSLPSKEHMSQICGALIQHVGDHEHNYSSILPSLRTLVMLTEHDYGYFHIKQGLDQHPTVLFSLFCRFSSSFSKDSSDCLSTLSTTLEFLRLMVQGFEDSAQTGRTLLLSAPELASLLKESVGDNVKKEDSEDKKHVPFQPVLELEKLLTECGNDEEAVESLLESLSGLLQLLNSAAAKETKTDKELIEPILPVPESQSAQFASRSVFMVGDVEEGRLSPAYWLSLPGAEDTDQEQEQVPVDLLSISEKHIPEDFDLKATLDSICMCTEAEEDLKLKKKGLGTIGGKRKYQPLVNPGIPDLNSKRPFIAPMRGRGFSRANAHSGRNDPFRSRPPNTSRPPSMHVDDFVALESHHSGSNSQAQAKRPMKEGSRGRGRGFDRSQNFSSTRGTGGRFFSSPGLYGRRDSSRGGNRGLIRISNNAWNNRSNQNQSSGQKPSTGTTQRNSFGNRRCDYNSPFNNQDSRPAGQRGRDSYTDMGPSSGVAPLNRFSRGVRVVTSMGQTTQGHWQDNRSKMQNQRFMSPGTTSRGRRDINTRHNRSFTR